MEKRECDAAFLALAGQQGVTGAYVTEIPPGKTLAPFKMAVEETIYVLQGRGLTSIRANDTTAPKTFEWQSHSLFLIPANYSYQLSNVQGNQTARLLHCSYLPLAMSVVPDPDFFFKHSHVSQNAVYGGNGEFYSEAKAVLRSDSRMGERNIWVGNFFPDMRAWDKLDPLRYRGAGGRVVSVEFPGSAITAHMSVFPPQTYKKAHRHGPGFFIVIPAGEGYSIMWPEGAKEKVVIPWHEASCFVPPRRWWHQHFNVSDRADRYLAIHPPRGMMGTAELLEDPARDQIEYPNEDSFIREKFEEELGTRGLKSLMPKEAYEKKDYQWADMTKT